ncbi:MAG: HemK2/MTQ2 family protein methyltransferase [Candidatus Micrarchaeaceae archaeon]|jgi:release factor glutamine methyltransferase
MLYEQIRPRLHVNSSVYKPLGDSAMLGHAVEKYSFGKMLDLGTGTGIQGIIAALKGCEVTFADINPNAVRCARENAKLNGVNGRFIVSDLFKNVKGRFNTIAIDPPFLRSRPIGSGTNPSFDGGINGREVVDGFLDNYKRHVMKEHTVLMVGSYLTHFEHDVKELNAEIIERAHYPLLGDYVVLKFL